MIRPQQKKAKEHKALLGSIRRGDKIVTGGGITGTVTKVVDDNELAVEIADGVRVRVQRGLIATVLSKTEPVKDDKKGGDHGGEKKGLGGLLGMFGGKK